jgi:peptide/nickel transport system substrate-binding protein
MNWNDPRTDALLREARTAVAESDRLAAIAQAQRQIAEANVWVPLARESLWLASSQRVEGARAHGLYGVALYKGLDIRLTR